MLFFLVFEFQSLACVIIFLQLAFDKLLWRLEIENEVLNDKIDFFNGEESVMVLNFDVIFSQLNGSITPKQKSFVN